MGLNLAIIINLQHKHIQYSLTKNTYREFSLIEFTLCCTFSPCQHTGEKVNHSIQHAWNSILKFKSAYNLSQSKKVADRRSIPYARKLLHFFPYTHTHRIRILQVNSFSATRLEPPASLITVARAFLRRHSHHHHHHQLAQQWVAGKNQQWRLRRTIIWNSSLAIHEITSTVTIVNCPTNGERCRRPRPRPNIKQLRA